jgi:hypothetical protein
LATFYRSRKKIVIRLPAHIGQAQLCGTLGDPPNAGAAESGDQTAFGDVTRRNRKRYALRATVKIMKNNGVRHDYSTR